MKRINFVSLALLITFALVTPALAWTQPTCYPPSATCDAFAPINVSAAPQTKIGGFTVGSSGSSGLLRAAYKFFVGAVANEDHPEADPLIIALASSTSGLVGSFNGNVGAQKYCDVTGNNCLTITQMGNASSTGGGGGVYVGATSSGGPNSNGTYDGSQVGGYSGGDTKCNAAFPGSRMATAADFANKRPPTTDNGWFNSFLGFTIPSGVASEVTDCNSWRGDTQNYSGFFWSGEVTEPSQCQTKHKILCSMPGAATGGGGTTGGGSGVYVGATSAPYAGSRGGYAAANALCSGDSNPVLAGSRVCNAADFSNGLPAVNGWYNSFTEDLNNASWVSKDCNGWNSASGSYGASYWDTGAPAESTCNTSAKFLCCKSGSGGGGGTGGVTSVTANNGVVASSTSGAVQIGLDLTTISTCTNSATSKIIWDATNNRLKCVADPNNCGVGGIRYMGVCWYLSLDGNACDGTNNGGGTCYAHGGSYNSGNWDFLPAGCGLASLFADCSGGCSPNNGGGFGSSLYGSFVEPSSKRCWYGQSNTSGSVGNVYKRVCACNN